MNTQDQPQKVHLRLSEGGRRNSEIREQSSRDVTSRSRRPSFNTDILDQNIRDASATPMKRSPNARGLADIPPTPAGLRTIKKRHTRTQAELLLDDASRFAAMDRRKSDANARRLIGEQLLNMPDRGAAPKERHRQGQLKPRDVVGRPEDYALQFDKKESKTQAQWAARMRTESKAVEKNIQKFGTQKQRLRALSTQTPQEEKKVYSQSSIKISSRPPSGNKRAQSFNESEPKQQREREGSHFFEKLEKYWASL